MAIGVISCIFYITDHTKIF